CGFTPPTGGLGRFFGLGCSAAASPAVSCRNRRRILVRSDGRAVMILVSRSTAPGVPRQAHLGDDCNWPSMGPDWACLSPQQYPAGRSSHISDDAALHAPAASQPTAFSVRIGGGRSESANCSGDPFDLRFETGTTILRMSDGASCV